MTLHQKPNFDTFQISEVPPTTALANLLIIIYDMTNSSLKISTPAPTHKDIVTAFRKVLRPTAGLVVVHSQIGAFGNIEDPAATILEALIEATPKKATIAMPTFTFDFLSSGRYDREHDQSETGLLTEYFRCQESVQRSKHPIYSYAFMGPEATALSEIGGSSCWGKDTIFSVMEEKDADIMMLGSSWEKCTFFHHIEQIANVPYRYPKKFNGIANFGAGETPVETQMQVRRLDMAADNLFDPIVEALKDKKLIRTSNLGRGVVSVASARNIFNVGSNLLKEDSLALIADREAYINARDTTRVALLSSANLDTFADQFEAAASEWLGRASRIFVPPFGQYRQNIYGKDSELFSFDPEWLFFLERAEDILGPVLFEPYEYKDIGSWINDLETRVQSYAKTIRLAREESGAKIIVLNFASPANSYLGLSDSTQKMGHKEAIEHANRVLTKELLKEEIFILDFEVITSSFGSHNLSDDKFWYLGRIPFSRDFGNFLSRRLLGTMLALTQKTARLIVTDLDNTLWHGVIGEDGVENIGIGTDFPGNAYRDFQKTLKALAKRGIALAICSKNTEVNALAAFSKRPEMVLNEDDFAAKRINWTDKANNIRSIADEMALGLGSICFLDDDPHERALVRKQLPEVFVPELPNDPVNRPRALLELPCLESLEVTPEDLRRSQQYKSRAAIESVRQTAVSLEDFYYDLKMSLSFEPLNKANQNRVLQLIAKTNQFNTTTRRYQSSDLKKLRAAGAEILAISLQDKFSEAEIIGVIILKWQAKYAIIDLFLLSCRVLGRTVECGILGWIANRARKRSIQFLEGEIIETERNQPVRNVFTDNGFCKEDNGKYSLELAKSSLTMPAWFTIKGIMN